MKRNLLLVASLFIGMTATAQFTHENTPEAGSGVALFVLDSLAPSYAAVTGDEVTWDYSGFGGYAGATRAVTVIEAAESAFEADFPGSTLALEIEDMLTNFITSVATGRSSQGFVFSEPNFGDIVVKLTDEQQLMNYPFDFGDNFADTYVGSTALMGGNMPITGTSDVAVDGRGTLILAGGSYSNVVRYSISDNALIQTGILGEMQLLRTQYEYYDHSISNLPIFIYASITVIQAGSTEPMMESFVVLSKDEPSFEVSVNENVLAQTALYPNPASEVLNIQLPSSVESADVVITDALGRVVKTLNVDAVVQTIDVSSIKKGTYFVKMTSGENSFVKTVVIK
ncbi:MAG TPA: T9SS type A sorting domain-containing protein [Brumimicrobium sp.]|nr:T9SS type A sorting domain-containing protein [Brumimicrobium sp.]